MRIVQFYNKNDEIVLDKNQLCYNHIKIGIQLDDQHGNIIDLTGNDNYLPCNIRSCIDLIKIWENDKSFKELIYR